MILLSSVKLEQQLASSALDSWEKAKYIIFVIILNNIAMPLYVLSPTFGPKPPIWNSIFSFLSSIITLYITYKGIKKCYTVNKDADDADFIGRFVTLYVPMTIKFLLIGLPIFAVEYFIIQAVVNDKSQSDILVYWMNLTGPILTYFFYVYLSRSFKRLMVLVKKENV